MIDDFYGTAKYSAIAKRPTVIDKRTVQDYLDGGSHGICETLFRSSAIIGKVKWLLEVGVPGKVVLELINLMEGE